MKIVFRPLFYILISITLSVATAWGSSGQSEPFSLFFDEARLPDIRERVADGRAAEFMVVLREVGERFMEVETTPYDSDGPYVGRNLQAQVGTLALLGLIDDNEAAMAKAREILVAATSQLTIEDYIAANDALSVGDAAVGVAIGYDWVGHTLTEEERATVIEDLTAMGDYLYRYSRGEIGPHGAMKDWSNHSIVANNGLLLAGEVVGKEAWFEEALPHIKGYMATAADGDGAPYEGAGYAEYGFQHLAIANEVLRVQRGIDLLNDDSSLSQLQNYMLHHIYPWGGGVIPTNQSSAEVPGLSSVYYAINRTQDESGLYVWLELLGDEGIPGMSREMHTSHYRMYPFLPLWTDNRIKSKPASETGVPLSASFERGMVTARTAWGDPLAGFMSFQSAKQNLGGWDHPDENTFTFSAFGDQFFLDPGPNFLAPDSHGIILIDGLGYTKYGGPGHRTQGRIEAFEDRGNSVYVVGEATDSYALDSFERPLGRPVEKAERRILFVRAEQPFMIIADHIVMNEGAPHRFTWQANYSSPDFLNTITTEKNKAVITGAREGAVAEVQFLLPNPAQVSTREFTGRYGHISNMLTVEAPEGAEARFLAAVASAPDSSRLPKIRYERPLIILDFPNGERWTVEVTADTMTANSEN